METRERIAFSRKSDNDKLYLFNKYLPLIRKAYNRWYNTLPREELDAEFRFVLIKAITDYSLEGTAKFSTYLIGKCIHHNTALRRKKSSHSESLSDDTDIRTDPERDTENLVFAKMENESIARALCKLKPEFRWVIEDYFYHDMSVAEIAKKDGLTASGANYRLKAALTSLSELYGRPAPNMAISNMKRMTVTSNILSPREKEVRALLDEGKTYQEIASIVGMKALSVASKASLIKRKLSL